MHYSYNNTVPFDTLLGKTLIGVEVQGRYSDKIRFLCDDGTSYVQAHYQDCCESVSVEEVVGDFEDLLNSPILEAEEVVSEGGLPEPEYPDSWTWSFYKLGTKSGYVTIRWLGESNGYYSETVDLFKEV